MDFIKAKCSSLNPCKCSLTSSHGLVFHSGHSFRLHRVLACGFVISLQLKSLSLHSTDRILIPAPQVTEHCKRNNQQWWKPKILHKKRKTETKKNCASNEELLVKWKWRLTLPQSPVIHVGQGLMLQPSLAAGLFSLLHPGLNWPLGSLQLTLRCLIPSPQETEH